MDATGTPPGPAPPATRTEAAPLASRVAVCAPRAALRLPVAANVRPSGSYSSAEARALPPPSKPPATSTRLSVSVGSSSVTVWRVRAAVMENLVETHWGSTRTGYFRCEASKRTTMVHASAPGGVGARPQGARGLVSAAQPASAIVASRRVPAASASQGGETRRRGAPEASRNSRVLATRRRPATPWISAW
ncbi:MAG: hypothetical protein QM820_45445 [Minicystis sp.]